MEYFTTEKTDGSSIQRMLHAGATGTMVSGKVTGFQTVTA
jgi:hypothetical protein